MSDAQFFLDRDSQARLVTLLREVPGLVEDLSVTLTRQSRMGISGAKLHARKDAQPLPYDINASEVADDLHNTLTAWARHVCEYRGIEYRGGVGTVSVARWLAEHVESLAMTEGSEEALDEVAYAMGRAREATDCRPDREVHQPSEFELQGARNKAATMWVTPAQAESLMPQLGHPAIKAATVRKWNERGKLSPDENGRYLLGALLELNPAIERMGA